MFYVPQRPSLLSGTPRDFLAAISSFSSRKVPKSLSDGSGLTSPIEISKTWEIDEELWDRNWTNLSGGESQRIALATALGLNTAEVLLLDGQSRSLCISDRIYYSSQNLPLHSILTQQRWSKILLLASCDLPTAS